MHERINRFTRRAHYFDESLVSANDIVLLGVLISIWRNQYRKPLLPGGQGYGTNY